MACGIPAVWREACDEGITMNPILITKPSCRPSKQTTLRRMALLAGASVLLLAGASSSCSTARGFGQDVEKTGDKIQDAASR